MSLAQAVVHFDQDWRNACGALLDQAMLPGSEISRDPADLFSLENAKAVSDEQVTRAVQEIQGKSIFNLQIRQTPPVPSAKR